mgnify:CR=1 FL=1
MRIRPSQSHDRRLTRLEFAERLIEPDLNHQRDDDGDLALAVDDLAVHVTADDAVADRQSGRAAQRQILADGGDGVGDGDAVGVRVTDALRV